MTDNAKPFVIETAHDTLYVSMEGSWTRDLMSDFATEFKKIVGRYFAREWACVFDVRKLELLIGEEALVAGLKAVHTWAFIKGMRAEAIVYSNNCSSYLLYQIEEVLKDKSSFERQAFESIPQAERWLMNKGFSGKLELQSQKSA